MLSALSLEIEPTLRTRKLSIKIKDFEGNKEWIYIDPVSTGFAQCDPNSIKYTPDGGTISIDGRKLAGLRE